MENEKDMLKMDSKTALFLAALCGMTVVNSTNIQMDSINGITSEEIQNTALIEMLLPPNFDDFDKKVMNGWRDIYNHWGSVKNNLVMYTEFSKKDYYYESYEPQTLPYYAIDIRHGSLVTPKKIPYIGEEIVSKYVRLYRISLIDYTNYIYVLVTPECLELNLVVEGVFTPTFYRGSKNLREGLNFQFFVLPDTEVINLQVINNDLRRFMPAILYFSKVPSEIINRFYENNYMLPGQIDFIRLIQSQKGIDRLYTLKIRGREIDNQVGSVWDRYALITRILRDVVIHKEVEKLNLSEREVTSLNTLLSDWIKQCGYNSKNSRDHVMSRDLLAHLIEVCEHPTLFKGELDRIERILSSLPSITRFGSFRLENSSQIAIPIQLLGLAFALHRIKKPSDPVLHQQKIEQLIRWLKNWMNEEEAWKSIDSSKSNSKLIENTNSVFSFFKR